MTRKMLLFVVLALGLSPRCGGSEAAKQSETNMKYFIGLIGGYHVDRSAWPASLDDLREYAGDYYAELFVQRLKNPVTGDDPGYEYVPLPSGYTLGDKHPRTVIVIYQLRNGKRDNSLPVGYLDKSVRPIEE